MGVVFAHKGHLLRVAALFAAGLAVFLVVRAVLVPKDFGLYGHYRGGALQDNRARPLLHAGRAACLDCHAEQGSAVAGGRHARVHCEACHGPLASHTADPTAQKAVRPDSRVLCARCHQRNVARPERFPQVDITEHGGSEPCISCHQAHDPSGEAGKQAAQAAKGAVT